MKLATIWMSIALLVAGCSDSGSAPDASTGPVPGDDDLVNETLDPEPPQPWPVTFFLDRGGLAVEPPGDGTVPLEGMAQPIATGTLGSMLFESMPWPTPVHVEPQTVTVTLVVQTDAVAVGNQVFDIAAWFGTSRGESSFGFASTGPLMPGDAIELVFEMDLNGHPGIVLPAGETFHVRVADSYEPAVVGAAHLVLGAEGSRVEFTLQNMTDDPLAAAQRSMQSFGSTIEGGTFAACHPGEEVHRFTVADNDSWVALHIEASGPSPQIDIDLDLMEGSTVIWHAGSPHDEERILVAGPALEPYRGQELGARASICVGGQAEYEITILKG